MTHTYSDFLALLRNLPEIDLMELLEISSDDLIAAFMDRIDDKEDYLRSKLEIDG